MATRRRRRKRRGAALVEAALVLPTLAIFLGLIMYEYRSYREKMRVQEVTRMNAFYYAAHGCSGNANLSGNGARTTDAAGAYVSEAAPGAGDAVDKVLSKNPPGAEGMRAATSRSFNSATSTMTGRAQGGGLAREVHGKSHVFCNERPEDGTPIGVIKWAFTFFRTGLL